MSTKFEKTKQALCDFEKNLECSNCRLSKNNLQYLGNSCKHAFCWDCITEIQSEANKKRILTILCKTCGFQLNMNKIVGATVLNNSFDLIEELKNLINKFNSSAVSKDFCSTQRIFENFDQPQPTRTIHEFLETQPAYLDDASEENEMRQSSNSPEIDVFTEYSKLSGKQFKRDIKEEIEPIEVSIKEKRNSVKRPPSVFDEDLLETKYSSSKRFSSHKSAKIEEKPIPQAFELFGTQIQERFHENTSLTPFVNRRSTAPLENVSGMVAKFSEPINSKTKNDNQHSKDAFTRKVLQVRKSMSAKEQNSIKQENDTKMKIRRSTRIKSAVLDNESSINENRRSISRSNSPASFEKISNLKSEPRRSSFGTRRGEVVIINSILSNRIPQLKSAIDAGTCVNEKENGKTPLFVAVENRNLEAVKILIEAGAIINATCLDSCETTLHEAVRQKNVSIVDFLLSKGASMKIKNSWQKTAEELICEKDEKMKQIFQQYKNKRVLQPAIPPRRPHIKFVNLLDEKLMTEKEKKRLPGEINLVSSEMEGLTHFVVDVNKKTNVLHIKKDQLASVLLAIIRPGLVVTLNWLKDCIQDASNIEHDRSYLVNKVQWLDSEIIEGSIDKWKKSIERMTPKLFVGCKFFFLRAKFTFLDRLNLMEIIRAGGGKAFPREPLVDLNDPPPYHNANLKPNFVVYSLNHEVPEKYRDKSKYTLICEQWLIEAILLFSISKIPY